MESKTTKVWNAIKVLAVITAMVLWVLGCYATYVSNKLEQEKNALIKEERDILLKLVPSRTPYPGNNPADPVCGDPAALKPTPEVHRHETR